MLTVCDSVLRLTPGLQLEARHHHLVHGQWTDKAVGDVRRREVVLRLHSHSKGATPVTHIVMTRGLARFS